MSIRALLMSSMLDYSSTLNDVDIFGDGSGKALYMLDDNVINEGGNYNGIPTGITYDTGKFGKCAVFNGSNSSINTGYSFPYTAFSCSVWYKYGNINSMILSSVSTNPVLAGQFDLVQKSSTSLLVEFVNNNSGTQNTITHTVTNMNDGLFHHIVITCESGGFIKLYFDGALVATSSAVPSFTNSNTQSLNLMRDPRNNYYKNGSLDQVRIFNKALSQSEVTVLYNEI